MPAVIAPAKVLVTGGTGLLGAWVARILLERGFAVRAAVRPGSKAQHLHKIFKPYGDRFETIVVEDITKPGAYDEAVNGVDAVSHSASPIGVKSTNPEDHIGPAVNGTLGILESVLARGKSVKRVVVTSSVMAVLGKPPGHVYTEADWNDGAVQRVKEQGENASGTDLYSASKTLAERAAREFVEKHRAEIQWDLTTILPVFIFGPPIQEVTSYAGLGSSVGLLWSAVAEEKPKEVVHNYFTSYVDVRDAAEVHVRALEVEEAGGERFIANKGSFSFQILYDALAATGVKDVPIGDPRPGGDHIPNFVDGSKAAKVLGVKFRDLPEIAKDTVESIRALNLQK